MNEFAYLTIAAVAATAAQAAEVSRVKSNAETARIQAFDPGANSFTQLDLSRNVTNDGVTTATAFLIVLSYSCNFPNCSGFAGSGPIPNSDFEGNHRGRLDHYGSPFRRDKGVLHNPPADHDRQNQGESNLTSAEASGSVLGNPLATPNSELIGTDRNRETTIIRE